MNVQKLAKHILLNHLCENCVYRSTMDLIITYCILDDHPGYDNDFIADNICNMYVNSSLWGPNEFFKAVQTNPVQTFNEIRDFVFAVERYKEKV